MPYKYHLKLVYKLHLSASILGSEWWMRLFLQVVNCLVWGKKYSNKFSLLFLKNRASKIFGTITYIYECCLNTVVMVGKNIYRFDTGLHPKLYHFMEQMQNLSRWAPRLTVNKRPISHKLCRSSQLDMVQFEHTLIHVCKYNIKPTSK